MLPTQIKDHTHAYAQVECCVAIEGLGQPVPFTQAWADFERSSSFLEHLFTGCRSSLECEIGLEEQ